MTIFGKVLLILNVAYSLLGLTWAVFVFATPLEAPDKLKEYKDKADVARKIVREALNNRDRAAETLRVAETGISNPREVPASVAPGTLRHVERDWYDALLTQLRVGDPVPVGGAPPGWKGTGLRAVQFDVKDGVVRLDPKNGDRPFMGPLKDREERQTSIDQPLEALIKTREGAHQALVGMNQKMDTLMSTIQKHIELTDKLAGSPEAKLKGLQQQLIEERIKAEKLLKQVEDLRPLYINSAVESELILRRLEELRKRYNELQKEPAGGK